MNEESVRERASTGIPRLDEMMDGGPYRGSVTLVLGAPGTGKTCLGLEFIARGAEEFGEPGLIVTFEHFPKKLLRDAISLGFDLQDLERRGLVRILFTSPEIFFEQAQASGGLLDTMVQELGARRILVDSISHLERLTRDPVKMREIAFTFTNALLRHGLTALVTQEDPGITGDMAAAQYGISYLVDAVIILRYVELDSSIARAMLVLKQRASSHDKSIREFRITERGILIGEPFSDREGVLSGLPRKREIDAFVEVFGPKGKAGKGEVK
ncbi:RAD55 family ATPase [Candidatus Solincola sp.]|jgi:circadian clock protein KaiC|nr:ATPase domain-containing protein [Actinomycetota bacterium]MDI7252161.1 ATPase domain-containing protein [Actinomycetota bacterium]